MSLILSGAKQVTIAGTEMACLEIYQDESYTLPIFFRDASGNPIDCTNPSLWALSMSAKWYTATVTYTSGDLINPGTTEIVIGSDLALVSPQPTTPVGLTAAFTNASLGEGYIFIPTDISSQTPETTPTIAANPSLIVVTTMTITRIDPLSGLTDVSKEPLGLIVRYQ
jgi:hypothetical protein